MIERLERLAQAGIQIVPAEIPSHFILERDGFVVFVERRGDGFGNIGACGLLTERGLAPLVWRGGEASFVAKGFEQRATVQQVEMLRAFADDVRNAISGRE